MMHALNGWTIDLAWALLHFVWQGALIGCASAVGLALMRNARPQARYAFCGAALLLCLVIPLWHIMAPLAQDAAPAVAEAGQGAMPDVAMPLQLQALPTAVMAHSAWPQWVVVVWSLGAMLMLLRMMLGLAWVQRVGAQAGCDADPYWQARLATLAERMGQGRLPRLRMLDGLDGPITTGHWRPMILMPAALLTHMPADLIEALLAHELAHIRRLDYLANLLQSVVEILLFYHPVVWWLSNRIRIEREQIADDLAADALGQPKRLARALSELDQYRYAATQLALAAHGGNLASRIGRLVRPGQQPLGWKLLPPILGLATLVIAAHASSLSAAGAGAQAPVAATAGKPSGINSVTISDADQRFTYALVSLKDGSNILSGTGKDAKEVEATRAALKRDFLWARQDGRRYVITDPATLAKAQALWSPVKVISNEMDRLGKQMDAQGQALARTAEATDAAHSQTRQAADATPEVKATQKQLAAAQAQQRKIAEDIRTVQAKLATSQDEKQTAQLQQQQDQLESSSDRLESAIETLTERIDQLTEAKEQALHAIQDKAEKDADKAMGQLESQMTALERKQDQAQKMAEQQLQVLIKEAIQHGLGRQASAVSHSAGMPSGLL